MDIQVKRVYDEPNKLAGYKVLVDRLWPRGIKKDDLHMDEWAKDITPSTQLRQDFHKGKIDYEKFASLYADELVGKAELNVLAERAKRDTLILLTAVKDIDHSHISTLKQAIIDAGE